MPITNMASGKVVLENLTLKVKLLDDDTLFSTILMFCWRDAVLDMADWLLILILNPHLAIYIYVCMFYILCVSIYIYFATVIQKACVGFKQVNSNSVRLSDSYYPKISLTV